MIDTLASGAKQIEQLAAGVFKAADLAEALSKPLEDAHVLNALRPLDLKIDVQAGLSDARRASGATGALEGLFVSVKDNVALDGYPTTGGNPMLAAYEPREGRAVARLRAEGAIFTAKTNLHELAFGITGANAHHGEVRNPFATDRLAGGSSSGAAVAVAVGACAVAIGTDTGGSCRVPAAHCGVVGFRPTTYRYPIDGYLRLSPSRDTLGVLARSVRDIDLVDRIISPEPDTPRQGADYKPRLGLVRVSPIDPNVNETFERAVAMLESSGYEIVEVDLSEALAADEACGFAIALFETAASMARLARTACDIDLSTFADAIASPDVRGLIASQCGPQAIPQPVYAEAITLHLPRLRVGFSRALEGVDALIYPTTPLTAPRVDHREMVQVGETEMPAFPAYSLMTRPDSMAGVPAVSLPCGVADGLPVGLQLVGRAGQDRALLRLAQEVEWLLPARPIPHFLKEKV